MKQGFKLKHKHSIAALAISLLTISALPSSTANNEAITQASCLAGDTFHKAAANGNLTLLKQCLAVGVAVDTTEANGWTALHAAAKHGQLAIVEQLLQMNASPLIKDKNGHNALAIATLAKQSEKQSAVQASIIKRLTQAQQSASATQTQTLAQAQNMAQSNPSPSPNPNPNTQAETFVEVAVTDPKVTKLIDQLEWELTYSGPSDPYNPGTYKVVKIKQVQEKEVEDGFVYQLVLDLKSGITSTSKHIFYDYKATVKTNKHHGHLHILQSDL